MDVHAEYFLKCPQAARWLNTPRPVSAVEKEFLDAAYAISTTITSTCYRPDPQHSNSQPPVTNPSSQPQQDQQQQHRQQPPQPQATQPQPPPPPPPPPRCRACNAVKPSPPPCPSHCPRLRADPHAHPHHQQQKHPYSSHSSSPAHKSAPSSALPTELCVAALERPFPCFTHLADATPHGPKSLLYVPVCLHDHFVFGVVVGCPVPPPDGVHPDLWKPLVTRFVLDAGRKCCLMFSYFAEGSIVVLVDCFDEVGDHFSEITFFEPTPVVGVFPRGIRARMHVFEKRDCPRCTTACVSCSCPVQDRVEAIVNLRKRRITQPPHAFAHAGTSYSDHDVTIQTYPYWAQILDEYKFSRLGSYCVQIRYTPSNASSCSKCTTRLHTTPYRTFVTAEARTTVDKMLRGALLEKGVSALKPFASDAAWDSTHTIGVTADNKVLKGTHALAAVGFNGLHKLPGFQEDYLLVAPSNVVSGAHARAELARAEAEQQAARQRAGSSVIPPFESSMGGFAQLFAGDGAAFTPMLPDMHSLRTEQDEFESVPILTSTPNSEVTFMRSCDPGSEACCDDSNRVQSASSSAEAGPSTSVASSTSCCQSLCMSSSCSSSSLSSSSFSSSSRRESRRKKRRKPCCSSGHE